MTAAELMAKLAADPEHAAARERRDAEVAARQAEMRIAEAPLAEALRSVGLRVESAWDLVNTAEPYPEALPVLVEHLRRPYPDAVREGIARALAVPDAGFAWSELVEHYRQEGPGRVKDALAAALAGISAADERLLGDVVALAEERRNGPSRVILLTVFRNPRPNAEEVLARLRADPELKKEATYLLRRLRAR
jgi:hypothetical protein